MSGQPTAVQWPPQRSTTHRLAAAAACRLPDLSPLPAALAPQQRLLRPSSRPAWAAAAAGRRAWCQPARTRPPAVLAGPSSLAAAARVSQASQRGLLSRSAAGCRSARQQRLGAAGVAIVLSILLTTMPLPPSSRKLSVTMSRHRHQRQLSSADQRTLLRLMSDESYQHTGGTKLGAAFPPGPAAAQQPVLAAGGRLPGAAGAASHAGRQQPARRCGLLGDKVGGKVVGAVPTELTLAGSCSYQPTPASPLVSLLQRQMCCGSCSASGSASSGCV